MDKEKQRRQAEQGEVLSRKSQADAELAEAQARLKAVVSSVCVYHVHCTVYVT
ncbi:hypothetical protein SARC_16259 [Sphaeroforma arctica JP610]|uniref:Uncharacterized protein n=1 Tax=Sphaeroforma arctica JP610 TaxID=667725 RepID=A0A0L0F3L8_9EUKA|nr:hypothetical protein SARC_16259 [Sphaeroforma arctica JP610]KNC71206.1 hypothetical protein SARC_16259 [Sphaeroforma arctica JP610]|eukprot:XP_014145108.1 hypothetical protein SARC_16259 [Sphaeroforma arctica JP610]